MKGSDREGEELENLDSLEEIDATECADDNEQLKRKFQDRVYQIPVLLYLKAHKNKSSLDPLR